MPEAVVSLGAITRNVELLRARVGTPAMVVVKADGYGHGALAAARAALEGGAAWLGTALVSEAIALREAGITAPVLAWLHEPSVDFAIAADAGVELGVSSLAELERAAAAGAGIHLKVDTGLGRNGASGVDWEMLVAAAADHERAGRVWVSGVWSHLANAGDDEDAAQIARFRAALDAAHAAGLDPEFVHLAATGGALRHPEARFSLVRFGIGAYGLRPGDEPVDGLTPAMELAAEVVSVKRVAAGHGVSYGYTHRTSAESSLALIPLGYADGVPRSASGAGPVAIGGRRFTVAGRIAMDQFVLDIGDADVSAGDRAVLFGDPATGVPSAEDWADAAGTINYEIVTRVGARVPRRHVA